MVVGLAATGFDETGLAVVDFLAGALVMVGLAAVGFGAPGFSMAGFEVVGFAAAGFAAAGFGMTGFEMVRLAAAAFVVAGLVATGLVADAFETAGFARDFGRRFGVGGGGMRDDDGVGVPALDMPDPEVSCRREGEAATSFASPKMGDAGLDEPTSSSRCSDNVLATLSPSTTPLPLLRLRVA